MAPQRSSSTVGRASTVRTGYRVIPLILVGLVLTIAVARGFAEAWLAADLISTFVFALIAARVSWVAGGRAPTVSRFALASVAGLLTANGGGTTRDLAPMITGDLPWAPPFWIGTPEYFVVTILGVTAGLILTDELGRPGIAEVFDVLDRLAAGVFAAIGAGKVYVLLEGAPPTIHVFGTLLAGGFTAAGGGTITALLFRRPVTAWTTIYGPASCSGALLTYALLASGASPSDAFPVVTAFTFAVAQLYRRMGITRPAV